jgi:hypothetical protein
VLANTVFVYIAGQLVNFKSALQFCMSFVVMSTFVQDGGMHKFSPSCNSIPGFPYIDTAYAVLSSFIAWLLLLPSFYEIGKILTPGNAVHKKKVAQELEVIKEKIRSILEANEPAKLSWLPVMLDKYKGNEAELLESLSCKYHVSAAELERRRKSKLSEAPVDLRRSSLVSLQRAASEAKKAVVGLATETRDWSWWLLRPRPRPAMKAPMMKASFAASASSANAMVTPKAATVTVAGDMALR